MKSPTTLPRLAFVMASKGYTQHAIAARLDPARTESYVSRRMTGRAQFSEDQKQQIATILNCPVRWLFSPMRMPARERNERNDAVEQAAAS